jgi:hypothetical protein
MQMYQEPRPRAALVENTVPSASVMGLLSSHVPLTLLADLVDPSGPSSATILATEGEPDTTWWLRTG